MDHDGRRAGWKPRERLAESHSRPLPLKTARGDSHAGPQVQVLHRPPIETRGCQTPRVSYFLGRCRIEPRRQHQTSADWVSSVRTRCGSSSSSTSVRRSARRRCSRHRGRRGAEMWSSIEKATRHLFRGNPYPGIHYYRWVVSSSLKARPDGLLQVAFLHQGAAPRRFRLVGTSALDPDGDPRAPRRGEHGAGPTPFRTHSADHHLRTSAVPIVRRWRPMGPKCSTLAGWLRHAASAHRPSARSPSVKRSFATSARARAPPTSSRASSGSRRSRSPITLPTSPARSGRRLSGCAWSRPGVSAAASSSGNGTASTGPRPAPFAGVTTSRPRASPSSQPEPDPRDYRWCPGAGISIRVCDTALRAGNLTSPSTGRDMTSERPLACSLDDLRPLHQFWGRGSRTGLPGRVELVPEPRPQLGAAGALGRRPRHRPRALRGRRSRLVVRFRRDGSLIPNLSKFVPKLQRTIMLPGCGYWTQQERARKVNAAMLEFLKGL